MLNQNKRKKLLPVVHHTTMVGMVLTLVVYFTGGF
jgi:hypothetical protein